MNLSYDALAALPSSGYFFVEDEVDDDEDDVDEQIGAIKIYRWIFAQYVKCWWKLVYTQCDAQRFAKVWRRAHKSKPYDRIVKNYGHFEM